MYVRYTVERLKGGFRVGANSGENGNDYDGGRERDVAVVTSKAGALALLVERLEADFAQFVHDDPEAATLLAGATK